MNIKPADTGYEGIGRERMILIYFEEGYRMKVDLENKVALITGASGGIGRGIALMFAKNGADIVISDISEEKGLKVADEIRAIGRKAIVVKTNVGDQAEVDAMVNRVTDEFGIIDILVNNAGINVINIEERVPIHEFKDENWKKILNVDLDGVYYCSKAVLKGMVKSNSGKIINISSVVGIVPLRMQCAFAAAKAGVVNLTKAMALEMAPYGINVNAIAPGSIAVDIIRGLYEDGRFESIMSHIPLKRPGTPEDIAHAALYLASDAANYVTGNVLVVDGGWTCGYTRDW